MATANRIVKNYLLREFKRINSASKYCNVLRVMFDGYRINEVKMDFSSFERKIYFSIIRLGDNLVQIEASFDCEYLFQFNCPIHELNIEHDLEVTMAKVPEYWIA